MSYIKRLQEKFRFVTAEYVPAVRNLEPLSELERSDQVYVEKYLKDIGLKEMSKVVATMQPVEYLEFINNLEDTSDDEDFH